MRKQNTGMSSLMGWVNYVIKEMVNLLDKERVNTLYLSGYNAADIAKIIKSKVETVRKCIQRNYSHEKECHERALTERRESLKAINYEATSCMGNKSFIIQNRSIYKTNKDGDIVINKKVAPIVTWDTPRRLSNEYKNCY